MISLPVLPRMLVACSFMFFIGACDRSGSRVLHFTQRDRIRPELLRATAQSIKHSAPPYEVRLSGSIAQRALVGLNLASGTKIHYYVSLQRDTNPFVWEGLEWLFLSRPPDQFQGQLMFLLQDYSIVTVSRSQSLDRFLEACKQKHEMISLVLE